MDSINLYQFTDCRSLEAHLHQAGTGTTGDKRLAIDLSYLRQVLWCQPGEENGDPLYGIMYQKMPPPEQCGWKPNDGCRLPHQEEEM